MRFVLCGFEPNFGARGKEITEVWPSWARPGGVLCEPEMRALGSGSSYTEDKCNIELIILASRI